MPKHLKFASLSLGIYDIIILASLAGGKADALNRTWRAEVFTTGDPEGGITLCIKVI